MAGHGKTGQKYCEGDTAGCARGVDSPVRLQSDGSYADEDGNKARSFFPRGWLPHDRVKDRGENAYMPWTCDGELKPEYPAHLELSPYTKQFVKLVRHYEAEWEKANQIYVNQGITCSTAGRIEGEKRGQAVALDPGGSVGAGSDV